MRSMNQTLACLQRHRTAHFPNAASPGYPQRAQLPDAPLSAMQSVASPDGRSGRRGGRAAPRLEQREPNGEQRRSDEQAEEAKRHESAEYAQDGEAQRHRHANAD